jgi:mRNA interferase MazF
MNQYQKVIVKLDPTVGSEMTKTRPCVILSPDDLNDHLSTVIIAPLTSTLKDVPYRVEVQDDGQVSSVALDQIRVIDKSRIIDELDALSKKEIANIKDVLYQFFVE